MAPARPPLLDLICGKTRPPPGRSVPRQGADELKENEIVQTGVGRKFQTRRCSIDLMFRDLEIFLPRGRTVFGSLIVQRDAAVKERVEESPR